MKNINWRDLLERAAWTFVQGFIVSLSATISIGMDGAALKAAILGAGMAGLSAVKTLVLDLIHQRIETKAEG